MQVFKNKQTPPEDLWQWADQRENPTRPGPAEDAAVKPRRSLTPKRLARVVSWFRSR